MSQPNNTTGLEHWNISDVSNLTHLEESLIRTYFKSTLSAVLFYVYIILSIWIIVANGVTLITFIKVRSLRVKRNFLIISLAMMDLFTGITPLLRQAISVSTGSMEPFTICMIAMLLQIIPAWSSLLHLFTIALERYIAITQPLLYDVIVTSSRLLWTIPINIGISIFFALIAIAWPAGQFQDICLSMLWFPIAYNVIFLILPMAGLLICLVGFYSRILVIARTQERAIASEASRFSNVEPTPAGNEGMPSSSSRHRDESRATRMFIMICGAALVCYVPWWLATVLLMAMSDNIIVGYYYYLSLVLLYANSGMNFVIYVAINSAFRRGIKSVFCKGNKINTSSESDTSTVSHTTGLAGTSTNARNP